MKPKVLNKRTDKIPQGAIYVGRPSKWGNPMTIREVREFNLGVDEKEANQIAVNWYRQYLGVNPRLMSQIEELKGRDLVCWCTPLPCHADVLLELVNEKPKSYH